MTKANEQISVLIETTSGRAVLSVIENLMYNYSRKFLPNIMAFRTNTVKIMKPEKPNENECATGQICKVTGVYYCAVHTDNLTLLSKDEKFPLCSQNGGHATTWLFRNPIKV